MTTHDKPEESARCIIGLEIIGRTPCMITFANHHPDGVIMAFSVLVCEDCYEWAEKNKEAAEAIINVRIGNLTKEDREEGEDDNPGPGNDES